MRHFFIRSLDVLIGIFVVVALIAVVLGAVAAAMGGMTGPNGSPVGSGIGASLFILIAGLLYVAFIAGFMYLGVGIYHNTKRTAEAVERLASK